MSDRLSLISDTYKSSSIDQFSDNVKLRKCTYYASDVLKNSSKEPENVESLIQNTIHVFNTLELNAEEHFYSVFRCDPHKPNRLYKDWKLSELACVYLSLNCDPSDLKAIARQQTDLIDGMLNYIHTHPIQMMHQP